MRLKKLFISCFLSFVSFGTMAQTAAEFLLQNAALSADLKFPTEIKELSFFSPLGMAIYKPEGAGSTPLPAMVIHHTCGGIRQEIRDWTKLFLAQGYVVFVLDSLGQRGIKSNCIPPNVVPTSRGVKDAFQALVHLKNFPMVDSSRVGQIGFSWGGMVGVTMSSKEVAAALSTGERYAAVASFYPKCNYAGEVKFTKPFEFLRADTDKPLLVLMGELDNETPPADCIPRIAALQAKGAPVESHLYPATTHCWDCSSLNNFRKVDFLGNSIVYNYNKAVTEDSANRAITFFAKYLVTKK